MKRALSVLLAAVLLMMLSVPALADQHAAEYLSEYCNVTIPEEITAESFNRILTALGQEPVDAETLTPADVCVAAVRLAGMEEFALTFVSDRHPEKAAEVLEDYSVTPDYDVEVEEAVAPYVAAALELGYVYNDEFYEPITAEGVARTLYCALEDAGLGRRYIGRVFDEGIRAKLAATLNGDIIFDEPVMTELGTEIVLRGATTGYGLKYAGDDAHFLQDYTLKYSHSDLDHALQLVALLRSEDIDGYIQIEPKVSVYEYMLDWGEPGDPTPTYQVKQVTEDRYLAYAVEYDMMIEFDTLEDKEAFHGIIEDYAKKYDSSFDGEGNLTAKLIAGSWWQPLYSSTTEMRNEEYEMLVDNVVYDETGSFSIHPFSVPENTEAIEAVVAEVAPQLTVSPVTIYANPAFHRYITGSDYQ